MDAEQQNNEDKVAQFTAVTGANPSLAQKALDSANWNLEEAVSLYFASTENAQGGPADDDNDYEDEPSSAPPQYTPQPAASSSSSAQRAARPKQMTLRDLQRGDDDDEEEKKDQDMFAGGEKSGLAVQNPGDKGKPLDHFKNIMNQARQNRERPPGDEEEEEEPRSTNFTGRAQTLGGDDAESQVIEDPSAASQSQRRTLPRVTRTLHLWADGVSIDDGPLLRFDDPANEHIMHEINQGRAPKALLDVQPDQEVDLNLEPHKGENYVAPKPKYKPFGGSGQRLGLPTPGLASASTAPTSAAPQASASAASSSAAPQEAVIDPPHFPTAAERPCAVDRICAG